MADSDDVRKVAIALALGGIAGAASIREPFRREAGKAKRRRMIRGLLAWLGISLIVLGAAQRLTITKMTIPMI